MIGYSMITPFQYGTLATKDNYVDWVEDHLAPQHHQQE